MFKIFVLCLLPVTLAIIVKDPPPSETDYRYSYNIEDPSTGDSKSQHEVRQGDVVSGAYSVIGPDGTKRIVEYVADPKHGFKATIREEPVVIETSTPYPIRNIHLQKPRLIKKPIVYLLEPKVHVPIPYARDHQISFFTPEHEYPPQRSYIENGHYFAPAK